jgi:hypothetical protein
MEPISTTLIAAISAMGSIVGKKAVEDAYQSLKELIMRKFGKDSKVSKAIVELEEEPESKAQKHLLIERMEKSDADKDEQIVQAAKILMEQLKKTPGCEKHVMYAKGTGIAQADRNSTATVTINKG